MVDTISNTINNNVYYLGINMGSRDCIIGGMIVVMGLLLLTLVIMIIVGIVKWIRSDGFKNLLNHIRYNFKDVIVIMIMAVISAIIMCVSFVLICGIFLFILSLLGKLVGMC